MRFLYLLITLGLIFSCQKENREPTKITAENIAIDNTILSSSTIDSVVAPYSKKLTSEMDKILSYTSKDLVRYDGEMQSTLGNLMADLCYEIANPIFNKKTNKNIDFAMFNYGGIRAGIPKGAVTTENAFNLMPFENELVVAELSGEKIMELVYYFVKNKKAHPLSKQVQLKIMGEDYKLKINGNSFDKNKTYQILTSDYLQNGGDRMLFFANPKELTKLDVKIRDAILIHFKKSDTLKSVIDNRVILN
jgi:5'-nucleotidase